MSALRETVSSWLLEIWQKIVERLTVELSRLTLGQGNASVRANASARTMDIKHNIIHASDFNMQSVQSRVHSCRLSEIHHSDTKLPLYHSLRTVKN